MSNINQSPLYPLNLNVTIADYQNNTFPTYSITLQSGTNKSFPGSYFVPVYSSAASNKTTVYINIQFLEYNDLLTNLTENYFSSWEINFGDGQKMFQQRSKPRTFTQSSTPVTIAHKYTYDGGGLNNSIPLIVTGIDNHNRRIVNKTMIYPVANLLGYT